MFPTNIGGLKHVRCKFLRRQIVANDFLFLIAKTLEIILFYEVCQNHIRGLKGKRIVR